MKLVRASCFLNKARSPGALPATIRMYTLNGARFVGVSQFDGHLRSVTSLLWVQTATAARYARTVLFGGKRRCGIASTRLTVVRCAACRLFSASEDRTINVWNPAAPAKPTFTLSGTHEAAITVRFTSYLAKGGFDSHAHFGAQGLSTFPVVQPTGGTTPYLLSTGMDGRVAMYALSSLDAPAVGPTTVVVRTCDVE